MELTGRGGGSNTAVRRTANAKPTDGVSAVALFEPGITDVVIAPHLPEAGRIGG
jgi:hypothetical protein